MASCAGGIEVDELTSPKTSGTRIVHVIDTIDDSHISDCSTDDTRDPDDMVPEKTLLVGGLQKPPVLLGSRPWPMNSAFDRHHNKKRVQGGTGCNSTQPTITGLDNSSSKGVSMAIQSQDCIRGADCSSQEENMPETRGPARRRLVNRRLPCSQGCLALPKFRLVNRTLAAPKVADREGDFVQGMPLPKWLAPVHFDPLVTVSSPPGLLSPSPASSFKPPPGLPDARLLQQFPHEE